MPSINMIAARRAEKKRIEKMVYCTLLVILGELAITLGVVGFMTARVHAANVNIRELDSQMMKLQPTVNRIKSYEGEIKGLKPRLDLLGQSRDQTLLWYAVMHDLASSMPEKTWLTGVSTSQVVETSSSSSSSSSGPVKSSPTVSLSGTSVSQKLVGEAMLRLNQCPEFDRVDLTFTQENTVNDTKALQFQIAAKLKPAEPQKGGNSKNASN
jgi:Tfp pilus assembly protein PilN